MAEKSIQLKPGSPVYLSTYCFSLIHSNRDKEAINIAKNILAIDDVSSDGYLLKATAESNVSDFVSAIQTLDTGISKLPDNYLLYSLRAFVNKQRGNTAAAAADEEKAKQLATK